MLKYLDDVCGRALEIDEISRALLVGSTIVLAIMLFIANETYLAPRWPQFGFTSCDFSILRLTSIVVISAILAFVMPLRILSPGDLLCAIFHTLVVIPAIAVVLAQQKLSAVHTLLVLSMCFGFSIIAFASRETSSSDDPIEVDILPLVVFCLIATLITIAFVTVSQWSVIRLVGLEDTYAQRTAGRAPNIYLSYAHTYLLSVFCPILIAYSLIRPRQLYWAVPGLAGLIVMYLITAQKQSLAMPVAMVALWLGLTIGIGRHFCTVIVVGVVLVAIGLTHFFIFNDYSSISSLILHRTFGIPALTLAQYYDFFSQQGFTYWSHVRGVSLFISPPPSLQSNPLWPALGYFIGEFVMGRADVNVNAGLFSSDGAGSAGCIGVVFISVALAGWVAAINKLSRGVDNTFILLALLPVFAALTSAPFFTVMLSFGGIFWIVALALINAKDTQKNRRANWR